MLKSVNGRDSTFSTDRNRGDDGVVGSGGALS